MTLTAWQARPLEPMYPVVFFDARGSKIREDAVVRTVAQDHQDSRTLPNR
ncbi:hypothetical protein DIE14_29735 [Burkholderia sp. Bp9017]|nr:transposase [Burkholderia anthina]RQZ20242.1 hypothetical protein DIE14_29735 [Burkholderia sp. Bp9017]RQZ29439.1 hypothetical protein DIE13_26470 [Burkholderia sp. Bp9016]